MSDHYASVARPPRPIGGQSEQVELADYVQILWRRRWLIVGGTIISGAVAFGISLFLPPIYQASAQVLVRVDPSGGGTSAVTTTIGAFQALQQNRAVAAQVVAEVGLDKAPYNVTAEKFATESVAVAPIERSNLLRVDVKAPDPKLAADAANHWVADAIALGRTMNKGDAAFVENLLKARLDEARSKMEQIYAGLLSSDGQHPEARRTEVDAILDKRRELLRMQLEVDLTRYEYQDLVQRYNQSRIQAVANATQLELFDAARPSEHRIAPRPLRNAALAVAATSLILIVVVFLVEYGSAVRGRAHVQQQPA